MAPSCKAWVLALIAGTLVQLVKAGHLMPYCGRVSNFIAETAPTDARCTGGFSLYREDDENIVGCYKYFTTKKTWLEALSICNNPNDGTLAAARTEREHNFLVGLRSDITDRFWNSGTSRGGTWAFEGSSVAVDRAAAYVVGKV